MEVEADEPHRRYFPGEPTWRSPSRWGFRSKSSARWWWTREEDGRLASLVDYCTWHQAEEDLGRGASSVRVRTSRLGWRLRSVWNGGRSWLYASSYRS